MRFRLLSTLLLVSSVYFIGGCSKQYCNDPFNLEGKSHSAITPAARTDVEWWMPRHQEVLERVAKGDVDMIFVGDSITHYFERYGQDVWSRYYAPRNAVNMGFSGDRTQHVLWRLENGEIDGINPKLAVVMIGTNNNVDNTAEEIADGIKAICAKLRCKLPQTKILLLAIFPRGDYDQRKIKDANADMNPMWAKNNRVNEMVSKTADNKMIYYLDINDQFLNEQGVLTRDVMPDLLHPREKGYQIWADAIEPVVKILMNED
jgi:lysophospholipase L1-like esterase